MIGDSGIKEEKSVPAFFYQSYKYGACPSDHWYVVTDEYSGIPEFSIGRWPVKTIEELDIAVNKRINYSENTPIDLWRNELLFIAGYEDAFKNQSENMINRQVPKEFSINRIYINPSSRSSAFFGGSDTLIYLLNNGLTLVNFMGHGGGGVWSDRSLFNTSHIEFLNNYDKLPFITSLTCFTADFASMTGLGEHMLLAENGGSIGLWGATSVGWIKNDYLLAKPFYDAIFTSGITVGEAIQAAKISYLADNYFDYLKQSMVNSFNLIGDPTLQLPFPDKQARLDIDDENPESGQTIELSGNLPFSSGEIYTQLYDSSTYRVFSEPLQQSFNNATIQQSITLPTEINPGSTFINYYFTNADQSLDGHGVTLLSIRGVNFYNLETFPNSIEKNTPFDISIQTELADFDSIICELDTLNAYEYLDENGIEFISSFQNPDNIFSKKMIRDSQVSQKWQTVSPITIGTSGKLIGVRFRVFDKAPNTTVSPNFSVKIKRAPDLSIQKIYQGGTHFPELIIDVNYSGDDTITTTLTAYRINGATESIFGTEHFQLYPNLNTSISVPGILGADLQKFKVVLDEQNFIDESNESNNVLIDSILISTYPLLPTIGTSIDGISYDTISVGNYSIYLGPNSIIDSSAIHFAIDTVESISDQPQFSLISLDNSDQFQCLNITIPCLHDTLLQPLTIKMTGIDSIDQSLSFGRWDSFLKLWIKENTTFTDSTISAESIKPGKFSLIKCSDVEPPQLELSLDGQQFFQNSYVSNKPNISIIGEDQNGVLLDNRGLIILLDGNPVNFSELNIPDTLATGRFISAQFRPELEFGDHDLEVKLKDAAGNLSTDQIYFTVSNEIKLIDYGNYPNPFKDRTVFIYELTQRVENFKIKIYTISGRLIKILEESTIYSTGLDIAEGGYHEILWDGRDENENFIANGVYFYKMIAQGKNKTVSSIGKIAKAR